MSDKVKVKKKPHFLVKLFFFITILFLLDQAIGRLLKHYYFKQDSGLLHRTTYAMDSTRADILIFGSSTANHHYISEMFNKQLHLSCYNTGREGCSILYSYGILQGILKRYNPQMIILDLYDHEFMKDQESYDRLSSLLPYYDSHPEIRPVVQLKGFFEKYKLLSEIYPYNSLLFTIGVGNSEFNRGRKNVDDQNGYLPNLDTVHTQLIIDTLFSEYKLDSAKINILKSFITDCQKSNIKLYVFMSPKFIHYKYEDLSVLVAKKIAEEYNIPFYNFRNDSFFLNQRDLFSDKDHLNDAGAKIYTELVIKKIEKKE